MKGMYMQLNERWQQNSKSLQATIKCTDFKEALDLVNRVAEKAEEQNHHPDICIAGYNQVSITMSSHDVGDVTERDYNLANAIDELLDVQKRDK